MLNRPSIYLSENSCCHHYHNYYTVFAIIIIIITSATTIIVFVIIILSIIYLISKMAVAFTQSKTISFDQNIFILINDLEKKRKRTDIDSIYNEIIKTIGFKDTTKDDLEDRINILLINEKFVNKINRNLNS